MAKLGPRKYRYTICTLNCVYMISVVLGAAYIGMEIGLKHGFPWTVFCFMLPNIVIACFGAAALAKQQGELMSIYGKVLIGLIVLKIIGFIVLIYVTYKRKSIIDNFLTDLMNSHTGQTTNLMDTIQNHFQCCGRKSYNDWTHPPPASCCKDCSSSYYLLYHDKGCAAIVGSFATYALMVYGLCCVLHTILHVFASKSALELAKIYHRAHMRLPSVTLTNIVTE